MSLPDLPSHWHRTPGVELGPAGFPLAYHVRQVRIAPAVVLAPMEGVTDVVFRRWIRQLAPPGLTYTEFLASRGLVAQETRAWDMARFDPDERPVALQIYGNSPDVMAQAARRLEDAGATILDINMGCPAKKVCKRAAGSGLMRDPALALGIVRAVRAAIAIPLTVKMRSGYDASHRNAPELAAAFEQEGVDGLTIHWRTKEDGYAGQRAVDKIAQAVQAVRIPVVANGDILDVASAKRMFQETGCAGVMLGRGAIRDPWATLKIAQWLRGEPEIRPSAQDQEAALLAYFDRIQDFMTQPGRALGRMKMVTRNFAHGLPCEAQLRQRVLRSTSPQEARDWVLRYFERLRAWESGALDAFESSPFHTPPSSTPCHEVLP